MLRLPAGFAALLLVTALAGCPGTTEPDAGPEGCVGQGDPGIAIGSTGVTWAPLADGASIPAWQRPQGGIGTRVNLRIDGYASTTDFDYVRVAINAVAPETAADGDLGGACRDTSAPDGGVADGGEEVVLCDRPYRCADDNTCQLEVVDITYNSFPRVCQPDGSLLAPEVPIRFKTYLQVPDVDGREATLLMEVRTEAGELESAELLVTLEESEFIDPETFDPLGL
jgi:hypothetical protein